MKESQKAETYRGEGEKKVVGVSKATLG